jgi:ubiquitin-protein ligase
MEEITRLIDIIKLPCKIENNIDSIIIEYNEMIKIGHKIDVDLIVYASDINSYHILRLIYNKLKIHEDDIINSKFKIKKKLISDYFFELKEILLSNFYDYCTCCGAMHSKLGLENITCCINPDCQTKIYHYPVDNKITKFVQTDITTLLLLFRTTLSGFSHTYFHDVMTKPNIYPTTLDIHQIKKLIPKELLENKLDDIIHLMRESFDDFYFWQKLDNNLIYALIINSISNNYYAMHSYSHLIDREMKNKYVFDDMDIEFFNINYTTETENFITKQLDDKLKYYYLYHGSPFNCWNSIIKNGLKNMSGTRFMTTGAAFGNGIYASNDISVSYSYARQLENFNYSMIGVFQIVVDPKIYNKSGNIYVVTDEKVLFLRTLIKIGNVKTSNVAKSFGSLNRYFIAQKGVEKLRSDENLSIITNKRFSAEIKLIQKIPTKYKIISVSDDRPWKIELLIKDTSYFVEITFHNYPLNPPNFKMTNFTNPILKGGIIDSEYKIILDEIKPSSWSITKTLIQILEIIWNYLYSTY